jgi:hypothetical protein
VNRQGLLAALAGLSLMAAGCGGGGSATRSTGTPANARVAAALALARCLRSHGIPNWPDPDAGGGFDKAKLRQLGVSASRMRRLEDGPCNIEIPAGGQTRPITSADRADYLAAAACMRSHGFPGFPDPTFGRGTVATNVPSSIDQDSARFKRAAAFCTRSIPAGLPYSRTR